MPEDLKLKSVRAEQAALTSFHEVATTQQQRSLGLALKERAGQLVSICAAEQGIMLNRSAGLGVFEPADEGLVDWTIGQYREHGISRAFICVTDGSRPARLANLMLKRGLSEARAWTKFVRPPEPVNKRASDLRIAVLDQANAPHWGRIVAASFDMPAPTAPVFGQLLDHPQWHLFMSFSGDEPAGAAGMFVHKDVAWFDWAATDPRFRRRGSQGSLMTARIEKARELGCQYLMTATGEAVPGDLQHSWGNISRYGFKPAFRSRNFVVTTT